MRAPTPAADEAGRPDHPHSRPAHRIPEEKPPDLLSYAEAVAVLAHTPHPMSERALRRGFTGRVWREPGRRGGLVSMSEVFAYQRDRVLGQLAAAA
jgi:hypothetical protein